MRYLSTLKYLSVFTLPALAYVSFTQTGWITFLPILEAFFLIPVLELFFRPNPTNFDKEEEQARLSNPLYDLMVYLVVPVQFLLLWIFLNKMSEPNLDLMTIFGRITAMGLLCGVLGINVAHELGHRKKKLEKWMAQGLLMTSLYQHFYIEHNRGHHRNVSTKEDPSSARLGESLYSFWIRSVVQSYFSAWSLEYERLRKKGQSWLNWRNEMIRFQFIQLVFVFCIWSYFGFTVTVYFLLASVMGFLLLETVNYIEHYGLTRKREENRYERVQPEHSWNSDHVMGRVLLFELSRHSDHHFIASRKYQVLRHMDESPQMPTGYPGMMLMAAWPPLWFRIMNGRIDKFRKSIY